MKRHPPHFPRTDTLLPYTTIFRAQEEPDRRERLWENARRLQQGFLALVFEIGPTETPIVPVLIGPLDTTFIFWRKLYDAGVFTNPVDRKSTRLNSSN